MLGIETLKKVLLTLVEFGIKIEEALSDGKINLGEAISLGVFIAPKAIGHAGEIQQIKAESNQMYTKIANFEVAKQRAANAIFRLEQAEKDFVEQLYTKYELDRTKNINVDINTGAITLTEKNQQGPVQ